jgi:hypothetical protein
VLLQHWGCFNPLRDIVAAAYHADQAEMATQTYLKGAFNATRIPKERLLFFSGVFCSQGLRLCAVKCGRLCNTASMQKDTM